MERRIERGRFSSRYGHHDGAYHQFFGDGAIPRSPLAGLGGMGSDGFDGTTGYDADPVVFNRKVIPSSMSNVRFTSNITSMSAKCQ